MKWLLRGIAEGLRNSGTKREDLFVATKLFNDDHSTEKVRQACRAVLDRLKLDYLDLYMVHW